MDPDPYGDDLFDEPAGSPDTLAHLGPLAPLAGRWRSGPASGGDSHPVADGAEPATYGETVDLRPIDRQTNGPQLFYGLRYHLRVVETGGVETFHDQVGYWLWEPAQHRILLSLAIPRGQVALCGGQARPDAREFTVRATAGDPHFGILSNPFLDAGFHTVSFEMTVTIHDDNTWSYRQDALLQVADRDEPFHHRDANTLQRIGPPAANPLAEDRDCRSTVDR